MTFDLWGNGSGHFTPDASYGSTSAASPASYSAEITVTADATSPNQVTPSIAENPGGNIAAERKIRVVCP